MGVAHALRMNKQKTLCLILGYISSQQLIGNFGIFWQRTLQKRQQMTENSREITADDKMEKGGERNVWKLLAQHSKEKKRTENVNK